MQTHYIALLVAAIISADMLILLLFARRYGLFAPVQPKPETLPSLTMVYDFHGESNRNIREMMEALREKLKQEENIEACRGLSIYFSRPLISQTSRLRVLGGWALEQPYADKADYLAEKGYNVATLPTIQAEAIHFPFLGAPSLLFAQLRAHPALRRRSSSADAILELVDIPNKRMVIAAHLNPSLSWEQFL